MDPFTRADMAALLEARPRPCLSIYLPTFVAGSDAQQNRVRLKNLLAQAEEELIQQGLRSPEAGQLLEPGRRLLDDELFWKGPSDGLAVFIAPQWHRAWRLPIRLKELLWVSERFYVKPLWALLPEDGQYRILAVSQNAVGLYRASEHAIEQIDTAGLPADLKQALHYDQPEGMFQTHSAQPAFHGKQSVAFHGQAGGVDEKKDEIAAYFRVIDQALHGLLRDSTAPLVFAGAEYLFPIYRKVNTYPHLADEPLPGNVDYSRPKELHERSLAIARPLLHAVRARDAEHYLRRLGSPLASSDAAEALRAAREGRVEAIFVASDVDVWGRVDPATGQVAVCQPGDPGAVELLDAAAIETFRRGGHVYSMESGEVPGRHALAALMRYGVGTSATPAG